MLNIKIQSKHSFLWAALQHLYIPLFFFNLYFLVVWMSPSLRNAFSTLKNNLKAVRSERQWKNSFHSGIVSADNTIWLLIHSVTSHILGFFFFSGELVQIMMATANENLSPKFCNRVLKFFTKLFQLSKSVIILKLYCPSLVIFKLFKAELFELKLE